MKNEKLSVANLLNSVLLLVLGIILLTNSSSVITIIAWVFGGILVLFGLVRIFNYFKNRKGNSEYYMDLDLLLGLLIFSLGCVLIFVPNIVDTSIRVICGGWIIIAGINRLLLGISIRPLDPKGSKLYIITSLFMILFGIFVLSNLFGIIGLYIIIYAVFDIIGYIYNITTSNKVDVEKETSKSANKSTKKKKTKTVKKAVKEKEAIDAKIEE